jgi:terminase small subunit-like protein
MPHAVHPTAKPPTNPKRAAHRPTKFRPELGEKICELIACGWLMKDAARHFGIPPETVCRWVVKHEGFREVYAAARAQRTEIWAEECIEIADDATRDYTTDEHGNRMFNVENVHRARLRIGARRWQMVRLDPRLWGDRQQIDLRKLQEPPPSPPPLVYRWEEAPEEPEPGGIRWQPRSATGRER